MKINFNLKTLEKIGLNIGCDVPLFIRGHSAFSTGKGENLYPLNIPKRWYLIVYPNIKISTTFVYKNFSYNLINNYQKKIFFKNIFEDDIRKKFYSIEKAITCLSKYIPFRLTGTGSCSFSEFKKKSDALNILKKIPNWLNSFIAEGINISPVHVKLKNII